MAKRKGIRIAQSRSSYTGAVINQKWCIICLYPQSFIISTVKEWSYVAIIASTVRFQYLASRWRLEEIKRKWY